MFWISSDSGWDIPSDWLSVQEKISEIPMIIILGDHEYADGVNITTKDIYTYFEKTGKTPKTAAIPPIVMQEYFERLTADGSEVLHISMSSGISATCNSAIEAAKHVKGVHVVDGQSLSSGTLLLAMYAKDLRAQGLSAGEAAQAVQRRIAGVQCSFVIDSLLFLHKGGRCSSLENIASSLLRIKPTIVMRHKMITGKKYLGLSFEKALSRYVDDIFMANPDPDLTRIFITHTETDQRIVDGVRNKVLSKYPFAEVHDTMAKATITCHCGKNTLGILYLTKE